MMNPMKYNDAQKSKNDMQENGERLIVILRPFVKKDEKYGCHCHNLFSILMAINIK